MEIKQGDVYWVDFGEPEGSAPAYRHPYVVIQNDIFNSSRINTVIGIALTSNISRGSIPGNVVLKKGEANLPKQSVVNVSQVLTIDKRDLIEKSGRLSRKTILDILEGLDLMVQPRQI